ncbi:DUF3500 domain-containing protein [Bythopirellula polymerisocia]|uniref:DUF3500 domain-containing protein n=1 Tax=Bythopirellula polymerisocia TaxID=2528003 RepID=A0A5C6CEC5_9BACT|nr:DUF3500 domain-containing protein [Bythopirellula polymerisocia]TWU22618.1 hypothetical protein Pla144_40780 [Bythopirellula polymerisocia]
MNPWNSCCDDADSPAVDRRVFLEQASKVALVGGAALSAPLVLPAMAARAAEQIASGANGKSSESLVKLLYEALTPGQREKVCFAWDHQDKERGLLRSRVANNWDITDYYVNDDFYTDDQRAIIRAVFESLYRREWHAKIDQQLDDDSGGFGEQNSIAIFGEPGGEHFEFVLTGRHMTVRCDGNTTEHVAFGGPIFYGHAADGFDEGPTHPGNVFWPQAVEANNLYQALDGKQQQLALVKQGLPREQRVGFQGAKGKYQGIPLTEFSSDQKERVQEVLRKLVEPYRQNDRDEVIACLNQQGGLDACHLAFYQQGDIGKDGVWDNWRLEGPSFVWHFRGSPHVHVWVNVANDASVKLNA